MHGFDVLLARKDRNISKNDNVTEQGAGYAHTVNKINHNPLRQLRERSNRGRAPSTWALRSGDEAVISWPRISGEQRVSNCRSKKERWKIKTAAATLTREMNAPTIWLLCSHRGNKVTQMFPSQVTAMRRSSKISRGYRVDICKLHKRFARHKWLDERPSNILKHWQHCEQI